MTVVGKGGKKGTTSKRNPCPPGSKKNQGGNKPHISKPPKKEKKPKPRPEMKKEDQESFSRKKKWIEDRMKARKEGRVIKEPKKPSKPKKKEPLPKPLQRDKKPEKPANKRTGQDYRDWADLRDRIKKHKESRKDNFRRLPGRM